MRVRAETSKREPKHPSTDQNINARAKMSKPEPKQSASQNVKAQSKNGKVQAKTSKRDPKCLSASWNIKAQAETPKRKLKRQAHAEMSKYEPEHENPFQYIKAWVKS